jgi:hypothetical protein
MQANIEGAADPLMDDADVDLVTASGDTKRKNIPAASKSTIYLPTEATATHIKSAASSSTVMEVLSRPEGAGTQLNLEASPPTVDGADVKGLLLFDIYFNCAYA